MNVVLSRIHNVYGYTDDLYLSGRIRSFIETLELNVDRWPHNAN